MMDCAFASIEESKRGLWWKYTIWHCSAAGWEGRGEGEDERAGVRTGEGRANICTQRRGLLFCTSSILQREPTSNYCPQSSLYICSSIPETTFYWSKHRHSPINMNNCRSQIGWGLDLKRWVGVLELRMNDMQWILIRSPGGVPAGEEGGRGCSGEGGGARKREAGQVTLHDPPFLTLMLNPGSWRSNWRNCETGWRRRAAARGRTGEAMSRRTSLSANIRWGWQGRKAEGFTDIK